MGYGEDVVIAMKGEVFCIFPGHTCFISKCTRARDGGRRPAVAWPGAGAEAAIYN